MQNDQCRRLSVLRSIATDVGESPVLLDVRTIDARVEHLSELRTGLVTAFPPLSGCRISRVDSAYRCFRQAPEHLRVTSRRASRRSGSSRSVELVDHVRTMHQKAVGVLVRLAQDGGHGLSHFDLGTGRLERRADGERHGMLLAGGDVGLW